MPAAERAANAGCADRGAETSRVARGLAFARRLAIGQPSRVAGGFADCTAA